MGVGGGAHGGDGVAEEVAEASGASGLSGGRARHGAERFLSAAMVGVHAMRGAALAPHRARDGAVPAAAFSLHLQLLTTASVQASPLLEALLLALARLHRVQTSLGAAHDGAIATAALRSRGHATVVLASAAHASPALLTALRRCLDEECGGARHSLPHLWPIVQTLVAPLLTPTVVTPALPHTREAAELALPGTATDNESTDVMTDTLDALADAAPDEPTPTATPVRSRPPAAAAQNPEPATWLSTQRKRKLAE